MKTLCLLLLCLPVFGQHMPSNAVRDRGQTRPQDESQSLTRGRLGTQAPIPYALQNYAGILVDASCADRSSPNLHEVPAPPDIPALPNPKAPVAAPQSRGEADRAGVLAHQNPDLLMRQPDPSCAVTAGTRDFALLLPDGRLLNLDEGGTTLAYSALNSLPEFRALINGTGRAMKPPVTLRGRVRGDRLTVEQVVKP